MSAQLIGKVCDMETDNAIPDVKVSLINQQGVTVYEAITSTDGEYTINSDEINNLYAKLSFEKDGYTTSTMGVSSAENQTVYLAQSGTLGKITYTLKQNKGVLIGVAIVAILLFVWFVVLKNKVK